MSIFAGVVDKVSAGVTDGLNALGFDWLTGTPPVPPPVSPIVISCQVEDLNVAAPVNHFGSFTLNVPNFAPAFGEIAVNMAQDSLALIELVVALQTISDPTGGITIKDALDPYHYNVVKSALEENGEPVTEPANPGATNLNKLGGAITASGALSGIGTAFDAMQVAGYGSEFLKFTPAVMNSPAGLPGIVGLTPAQLGFDNYGGAIGTPIFFNVSGAWPDLSFPLSIIASVTAIKGTLLTYAVSILRNAIDSDAQALVFKHVLDDFSVAASNNAIAKAKGPDAVPDSSFPTGADGVY